MGLRKCLHGSTVLRACISIFHGESCALTALIKILKVKPQAAYAHIPPQITHTYAPLHTLVLTTESSGESKIVMGLFEGSFIRFPLNWGKKAGKKLSEETAVIRKNAV